MRNEFDIRNEEMLLPALCRLDFSNEQTVKINELVKCVADWEYFASLANEHGVVALVFYNLEKSGFLAAVPEKIASILNNAFMLSLSRNSFHTSVISELLRILNEENIKSVLLKGMALELSVYGNTGLRQMTDIDILIDRNEYKRARKTLIKNGFVSLPVNPCFTYQLLLIQGSISRLFRRMALR